MAVDVGVPTTSTQIPNAFFKPLRPLRRQDCPPTGKDGAPAEEFYLIIIIASLAGVALIASPFWSFACLLLRQGVGHMHHYCVTVNVCLLEFQSCLYLSPLPVFTTFLSLGSHWSVCLLGGQKDFVQESHHFLSRDRHH